ncbi:MAG: DUF5004 domain-containing protein [Gelidibacter sp.]
MKLKPLKITTLFLTILMFNCSNNDDVGSTPNNSDIVGTWNIVSLRSSDAYDFNDDGTASQDLETESDCITEQLIFNSDGTYSGTTSYAIDFLTEINNILCFDNGGSGTWTREGNTVSFTGSQINGTRTLVVTVDGDVMTIDLLSDLDFLTFQVVGTYHRE